MTELSARVERDMPRFLPPSHLAESIWVKRLLARCRRYGRRTGFRSAPDHRDKHKDVPSRNRLGDFPE
jgi:hypothetical protein